MLTFDAGSLRMGLDGTGRVASLYDVKHEQERLAAGVSGPLLRLTIAGQELLPNALAHDRRHSRLRLTYDGGIAATVAVKVKPTHVTFELVSIEGAEPTRVDWGPFPTAIGRTVGETIGVVRDGRCAVGIQSLNIQTIGGAEGTDYGSALWAYAIDHDGGVKGSKIAFFGCAARKALATVGEIEGAEGLPHPMLDGEWGKASRTAKLTYLICPFGEQNLDEVLQYARMAGLEYVYHPGAFETWGHFKLNSHAFPDGDQSMRRCVERAGKVGIRLGLHTLTAFITTNDPYVTPIPDPRLARVGSSILTDAIDATATEIGVADPGPFTKATPWEAPLNTVIIGQELAQYQRVSEALPWKLLGCTRGAFGTKASTHEKGADIGKLADHAYRTFYPGIENGMMDEMTDRLIELFNRTGLRQISFDGLEGLIAYGHGQWAEARFVKQCFDGWKPEVISDASGLGHFAWHIHTRMNWGEPWGHATREGASGVGSPQYRFKNVAYFERNLFPRMLGWFQLRLAGDAVEATSLEDIEWVLSKCAGLDAGFGLTTSLDEMKGNGQTAAMLRAVRDWEAARLAGAFTRGQRRRLKDLRGEFHLERVAAGKWRLRPVHFSRTLEAAGREALWDVENPFGEQPLRFVLCVVEGGLRNPRFEVGGQGVAFPAELEAGQYLVCAGDDAVTVCDANWNALRTVQAVGTLPRLAAGRQTIRVRCEGEGQATVRLKMVGEAENVG